MSGNTCLSGQYAVVSYLCAACPPYLGAEETIFPYFHIMSQMNQVIYLCPTTYYGAVHSTVVHGTAGSDFHVIMKNYIAQLPDVVVVSLGIGSKAKPLSTDCLLYTSRCV